MATKTVVWNSGSGVITLAYTGQGNDTITVQSDANDSFDAREQSIGIVTTAGSPEQAANVLIKQSGKPLGWTVKDFDYTGGVQEVTLPKGTYKLQCWGAQGGNVTGTYAATGSKGGYSEGVLTLTETTTLYIFVGGQGASSGNGGWNGGGGSSGYSTYTSSGETGRSYPACGGGATDIALVTSSMDYSNKVTNRSSESLLSRIIVAGGGAGASARYTSKTVTTTDETEIIVIEGHSSQWTNPNTGNTVFFMEMNAIEQSFVYTDFEVGDVFVYDVQGSAESFDTKIAMYFGYYKDGAYVSVERVNISSQQATHEFTLSSVPEGMDNLNFWAQYQGGDSLEELPQSATLTVTRKRSTTSTSTSSNYTTSGGEGGGTTGNGSYKGTQSSASGNGGFGYGANMTTTNYMYCGGAGGGGWYGGGTSYADSSTGAIYYGSGGSGFVNTAANSSYRPSGYTGLELDSGSTTTGQNSGNGYAKITVLGDSDGGSGSGSITWATQSGTWTESSSSSAADGKSFTCTSPGTSGSTVIRCTFSGVTSITFNCVYNGESNYDYLTVGSLDTACTRSSYGTTLKGTSGTAKSITFSCDSGEHYVEFCYSKDGSVDTSPDNATVYVESYS